MRENRFKRILVYVLAAVVGLSLAVVLGISLKVGWSLTHPQREHVVLPTGAGKLNPKQVSFPSRQGGVTLQGSFLSAGNSNRTIIFAHGYGKNRLQDDVPALDIAQVLRSNGYNVLLFDFRGSGESGGDMSTVGQYEKDDLIGAVDFMKKMGRQGEHIGVIGFSMGAVAGILAAAEDTRIEALAADAPFADLVKYLRVNLPVWSDLPSFPFTPLILTIMPPVLDLDPHKVSPVSVVRKIRAPVLFIHGGSDTAVPVSNSEELYRTAPGGKKLLVVPGAEHVGSYKKRPQEYISHILELFKQVK